MTPDQADSVDHDRRRDAQLVRPAPVGRAARLGRRRTSRAARGCARRPDGLGTGRGPALARPDQSSWPIASTSVDVLVRSAPDAEEIAEPLADDRVGSSAARWTTSALSTARAVRRGRRARRIARLGRPRHPGADLDRRVGGAQGTAGPVRTTVARRREQPSDRALVQPAITTALPRDEAWAASRRDVAPRAQGGSASCRPPADDDLADLRGLPVLVEAEVALADGRGPLTAALVARSVAARFTGPTLMDPVPHDAGRHRLRVGRRARAGWYFVAGALAARCSPGRRCARRFRRVLEEESCSPPLRVDDHAACAGS